MDTVALLIIAVAVAGVAWLVFFNNDDKPSSGGTSAPTAPSAPAKPVAPAAPATPKASLPAGAEKMTKAQIESEARAQGVELDKRKTKANMLSEWKESIK